MNFFNYKLPSTFYEALSGIIRNQATSASWRRTPDETKEAMEITEQMDNLAKEINSTFEESNLEKVKNLIEKLESFIKLMNTYSEDFKKMVRIEQNKVRTVRKQTKELKKDIRSHERCVLTSPTEEFLEEHNNKFEKLKKDYLYYYDLLLSRTDPVDGLLETLETYHTGILSATKMIRNIPVVQQIIDEKKEILSELIEKTAQWGHDSAIEKNSCRYHINVIKRERREYLDEYQAYRPVDRL
jgi:tRNA uridine 5-carbamoylmethylation protein Kti12